MPVYNAEKYISEAIESILNQTYKDFEFIIINDGSTDKSLDIIKKYKNIDDRIVLVDRKNKGLVCSLNEGIELAAGKYIARMDADDICLSSRLEKQILFLEKNENIIACGSWVSIFTDKSYIKIVKFPPNDEACLARLLFGVPIAHPSAMIKKSLLSRLKNDDSYIYDEKMKHIEDYDLWVRLSRYGKYSNIQEPLLKYRNTPNSATDIGEKNIYDRYNKSIIIFSKYHYMYKLFLFNNDFDKERYFNLALNKRVKSSFFSQTEYLDYLDYLIIRIFCSNQLSDRLKASFRKYLLKKYLVVVFYKRQNYKFFLRKNFYIAIIFLFTKRLNNL
ncbi:UNVERIFIED_CONTAM: hypothetical protein GTU68_024156 [Idotea baltica]|nr:hypothetical protein [Idotea baltica]